MPGLRKVLTKCCSIDAWQDSEYSSSSEYGRVLSMPGLRQDSDQISEYVLKTTLK